jgi:hypothetical protein
MKLKLTLLLAVGVLALAAKPARAQRVSALCEANSGTCGTLTNGTYISAYGTNLPVGDTVYVYIIYPVIFSAPLCDDPSEDCQGYVVQYFTPTYTSSTQTNFYLDITASAATPIFNQLFPPWFFQICYYGGACTFLISPSEVLS